MTSYNSIHMCPPKKENIDKPFFAYGIFKPGQIAFSKIKDCQWKYGACDAPYRMRIRDGVPIIENIKRNMFITKGYKIYFNKENREKAYIRISKTEPYNLYEWDVIDVCGEECNVLIGKDYNIGSKPYEDKNYRYIDEYDGKKDPYFFGLTEFIRNELDNGGFYGDDYFYKLQMHYMLLWSAIDRYCSLKYGAYHEQWKLRLKLADDPVFNDSFQKCWNENKIKPKQFVYSTNLREFKLNRNPRFAINYYYTIRCNVVHRGKQILSEEELLEQALNELLDIFEGVIKNTFKKF